MPPTSGNLLCVQCARFMFPKKNSVTVEELMEDGDPYRLWDADLWECGDCGTQIVSGFAREPFAEHYEPNYAQRRARLMTGNGLFYSGKPR